MLLFAEFDQAKHHQATILLSLDVCAKLNAESQSLGVVEYHLNAPVADICELRNELCRDAFAFAIMHDPEFPERRAKDPSSQCLRPARPEHLALSILRRRFNLIHHEHQLFMNAIGIRFA